MPRLNLFLNADVALDTDQILFNQFLLAPEPKLGTKAQRKALHCILSNVGKYRSQPLLYSTRNQANPPEQYNPYGYGHKPLVAVIKQLRNNGMLKLESGTPRYTKTEQGDFQEPKLYNGSRRGASMAARSNLYALPRKAAERFESDALRHRVVAAMMRLVEERSHRIAACFYQGKAQGQYYALLESNSVFEVAKHLSDQGVPALTVHDEFIVSKSMENALLECRYKVLPDESVYAQAQARLKRSLGVEQKSPK